MIKAVFFDIDGTITKDLKIPNSFKIALKILQQKDILCFIATGRHQLEIEELNLLEDLTFDGYLTVNGGYCFNQKEVFFDYPIAREDIEAIIKQIKVDPYPIMFIEKDKMYMNLIDEKTIEAQRTVHMDPPMILDVSRALEHSIYQMISFDHEEKPLEVTKYCRMTRWHPFAYDVIPIGSSKQVGIDACLSYYNIKLEETMAFGDGLNDLEMLQHVQIGVALGNAHEELKKVADYVTTEIHEDGVYHALKHYKII